MQSKVEMKEVGDYLERAERPLGSSDHMHCYHGTLEDKPLKKANCPYYYENNWPKTYRHVSSQQSMHMQNSCDASNINYT